MFVLFNNNIVKMNANKLKNYKYMAVWENFIQKLINTTSSDKVHDKKTVLLKNCIVSHFYCLNSGIN